jgi:site-specific DNA-cytosine methylase
MKVIEMCSGYGGATAGMIAAGLEIEKCYDNWRVAIDAHRAWHPEIVCEFRDVSGIEPEELKDKIVWASLPCQPWSTANRVKRGKSHSSYYSLAHFAHQVQFSRFAILENVPGLVQEPDGKAELEELRSACKKLCLTCDINLIPAWWFGVAQLRKRVIITINAPWTLFGPMADVPDGFSPAPTASDGKSSRFMPDGSWDSGVKRKARKLASAVRATYGAGSDTPEYRKLSNTVLANRDQGRGRETKWSCVPTAAEHAGHTSTDPATGEVNFTARSILECATLQGVPLEHIQHLPKTHQYTLIGNAVHPSFAKSVMQTILEGES